MNATHRFPHVKIIHISMIFVCKVFYVAIVVVRPLFTLTLELRTRGTYVTKNVSFITTKPVFNIFCTNKLKIWYFTYEKLWRYNICIYDFAYMNKLGNRWIRSIWSLVTRSKQNSKYSMHDLICDVINCCRSSFDIVKLKAPNSDDILWHNANEKLAPKIQCCHFPGGKFPKFYKQFVNIKMPQILQAICQHQNMAKRRNFFSKTSWQSVFLTQPVKELRP